MDRKRARKPVQQINSGIFLSGPLAVILANKAVVAT
jgi:hypothetical protein